MRVMLDTNILVSLIFPSAVTRDFARRVGLETGLYSVIMWWKNFDCSGKKNFRTERRFWNSSSMNYPLNWSIRQKS